MSYEEKYKPPINNKIKELSTQKERLETQYKEELAKKDIKFMGTKFPAINQEINRLQKQVPNKQKEVTRKTSNFNN